MNINVRIGYLHIKNKTIKFINNPDILHIEDENISTIGSKVVSETLSKNLTTIKSVTLPITNIEEE